MDVLLDEYEEMLKHTAREFFERECPPALVRRMEADELGHSVEMWRQIAALGWLGFALPQAYGGEGHRWSSLGCCSKRWDAPWRRCPFSARWRQL
jgi:alkylation response protein AidB-like acyl-CoA dehydrogenase